MGFPGGGADVLETVFGLAGLVFALYLLFGGAVLLYSWLRGRAGRAGPNVTAEDKDAELERQLAEAKKAEKDAAGVAAQGKATKLPSKNGDGKK